MQTLSPDKIQELLKGSGARTLDETHATEKGDSRVGHALPLVPDAPMQECDYCGYCEEPENCVYGVQCPECNMEPKQQCIDGRGGLTGLHEARHKEANSPYWKEYR